jgi:signal transduction histidine kinase
LRHRKQVFLFLVAVLIPSLTLIFFTQRLLRQDRELAQKRAADERKRLALEIGSELHLRLERTKLEEGRRIGAARARPEEYAPVGTAAVAFGFVEGGRLVPPWQALPSSGRTLRYSLEVPAVAAAIRDGERAEFERRDPARAADLYRKALGLVAGQGRPYVRLLLARALAKSGRPSRAYEQYEILLDFAPGEKDEDGMPLYLYAADRLADAPRYADRIAAKIGAALEEKPWMALPETGLVASLLERIVAQPGIAEGTRSAAIGLGETVRRYRAKAEHLVEVQQGFERSVPAETAWEIDGRGEWLLGIGPLPNGERFLLAIDIGELTGVLRTDETFRQICPGEISLAASESAEGDPLGPSLRGLSLVTVGAGDGPAAAALDEGRPFYVLTVAAVIIFACLGGYLLWRDVRRELALAEIRSQFAASVSHELKTPLTAIRMFAETVRLGRVKDEPARNEYLDTIINESERLSRLLNNVLDISKIEQGKKLYHPRPQALAPILRAAVRTMDYPLRQQGFSLRAEIDEGLPEVRVDADALEQAVLNLIGNAIKYSGAARDIGLTLGREGGWAVIRVTDHGVGIPPGDKQRIFEKYFRVQSTENRQVPGTGLGLALVAHFVQEHAGRIEVESAPGRGSTFSLYLPLEVEP